MININNIIHLQGRLVADPELKTTGSGVEVCSFCIAVDRGYAKQGEEKQTDFISCTAWRQTGVFIQKYFAKGKEIKVVGSLQSRKYEDKDGKKRTAYDVIVEQAGFCGSKNSQNDINHSEPASSDPMGAVADDDEDFPFE